MNIELYLRSASRQLFGSRQTGYFRGDLITFAVGIGDLSKMLIWVKGDISEEEFVSRTTFTVCCIFSSVKINSERKKAYRFASRGKILAHFPGLLENRSVDDVIIT